MALFPTCKAKNQGDALGTQKTEDEENGYFGWFWGCVGWRTPWRATLERRPNPSARLSFGYAGTYKSTISKPSLSTEAFVAGSGASSHVSFTPSTYHCDHPGCNVFYTVPSLIDWHREKDHNGDGGYGFRRQDEGPRDPANLRQEATTTTALGLHVTEKPKVLAILSCKADGCIEAFVQSEEQGTTKQWPKLYSLAEFRELGDALIVLENFLRSFS
ncbi:hypothetical protein EJ07DRAFT_168766 [Lizonia empirigonia]|nr:hypothetical protein EJ07DRAFT_168766 [Lizonia empirigonia]